MCQSLSTSPQLNAISSQALTQVWEEHGISLPTNEREVHVEAVANILRTNLSNGREQRVVDANEEMASDQAPLRQYAARVARHYWAEHERLDALLAKKRSCWDDLRQQLLGKAYYTLRDRTSLPQPLAYERANDYAQRACELIFSNRYPCDVPFEAWAVKILTNCIYADGRSTDLLDRGELVTWDRAEERELYPDGMAERPQSLRRWELKELLLNALQHLNSEAQRQVIILDFWYGESNDEIAERLGKSKQAVYNLRHRALTSLEEILEPQQLQILR